MSTSAPAGINPIRVNENDDEVQEENQIESKDKLPPIPKVSNFGDVVKLATGQ